MSGRIINLPGDARSGAGGVCAKHGLYDGIVCANCTVESWQGPWRVEGPWHHESGYPQTWSVSNSWRTLCESPTERGAEMIVAALEATRRDAKSDRR